jgi:hypothetical protein
VTIVKHALRGEVVLQHHHDTIMSSQGIICDGDLSRQRIIASLPSHANAVTSRRGRMSYVLATGDPQARKRG